MIRRYKTNLNDPKTTLGSYKQRLDIAYKDLNEKHLAYLDLNKQRQLEERINSLNGLINNRKLSHHSPPKQL